VATLIPHWLPIDVVPGERKVFDELKADPIAKDWIILHSYCLSKHLYQERGEIDFVVIAPGLGVMVVEVKSHSSVKFDGEWHLGRDNPTSHGPINQAMKNMYSLRDLITDSDRTVPAIDFCVIFPFAQFSQSSPEWHDWQVIDKNKGESRGYASCIRAALIGHLENVDKSQELMQSRFTDSNATALANFLRPRFEVSESLSTRDAALNKEYKTFLDEQFEALDQLDNNPALLFEGAAGTGKTLLALETASRALLTGKRVLMLCFNRHLAKYLQAELGSHQNLAFCGTFSAFMAQVAGLKHSPAGLDFTKLAESAIDVITNSSKEEFQYDVLVIDEIQDIASSESMDFIELLIDFAEIRELRFFGDFEFQKLYFDNDDSRETFINRFPKISTFKLWSNCRNRPEFGDLISSLCSFSGLYKRFRLPSAGKVLTYITYDTDVEKISKVESALEDLLKTFVPGQVVVLGESQFDHKGQFSQSMAGRFQDNDEEVSSRKKLLNTTIRKFKGLEAKAVIIHDFNVSMDRELLYAGITRAIENVVLVGPKSENVEVAMKLIPKL
jgi:ATP:corrinoid adenosyltransferase